MMFNVLMENLDNIGYSTSPRYALEMALIKAAQAAKVVPVSKILGRLDDVLAAFTEQETAAPGATVAEKKKHRPSRQTA